MKFSSDWFSHNIPHWTEDLSGFVGKKIRALEVGCFEGRATAWLLQNVLTHLESKIVCIDTFDFVGNASTTPNPEIKETFVSNMTELLGQEGFAKRVELHHSEGHGSIMQLARQHERFNFIYVDASHLAADVLLDGILSWGMLNMGGILTFDDYAWAELAGEQQRPKIAIDTFLALYNDQLRVLRADWQATVRKGADCYAVLR